MKYDYMSKTELKLNEVLERLERIEKMLQRLTGNDYSGRFIPKPTDNQWIDPESSAGNWQQRK